uniref:Uncharacterized protein n=1 Tax=Tanacetum cinerariifolium TaxID=118510 RepID=A0A6L2NP92_TANCI|nr:hypothetical protein [Tanacetum cinerariifolium]
MIAGIEDSHHPVMQCTTLTGSNTLSWKSFQGDYSKLNIPDHRWRLDELEDDTSSWYCSKVQKVSTRFRNSVQGSRFRKKSILEVEVAQDDWWIKHITAKLLKDLKELAEYDQSTNTDRPIFLNSDEGNSVQDKKSLENPFNEIADNESDLEPEATTDTKLSGTEDIHPLAVQESPHDSDICQLIREECSVEVPEDALDSKLLSINSINSQRLDKKEQEVKNVEEQLAGRRNQPEHLLSMGYEHLSITPKTEYDEVTESNAKNLLPIPSKCDVTLEDEIEYSHCFNVESDFVESLLNRDTFNDFSSKFDFSGELSHIKPEIPKSDVDFEEEIRLIENLLYDNSFPRPPEELNAEIANTIIESIPLLPIPVQDGNSQQEEIDIVTETDDVLPPSVENDNDD